MLHRAIAWILSEIELSLRAERRSSNCKTEGGTTYVGHDAKNLSNAEKVALPNVWLDKGGASARNVCPEEPVNREQAVLLVYA